jgi:prephenate dehydrogenase
MTEFDWLYPVIMPLFIVGVGGIGAWAARRFIR